MADLREFEAAVQSAPWQEWAAHREVRNCKRMLVATQQALIDGYECLQMPISLPGYMGKSTAADLEASLKKLHLVC